MFVQDLASYPSIASTPKSQVKTVGLLSPKSQVKTVGLLVSRRKVWLGRNEAKGYRAPPKWSIVLPDGVRPSQLLKLRTHLQES
jgi:hypothetical protein